MTTRMGPKASYADLERLPANVVGELIDGVLHATPRPASPHVRATSVLGSELGPPFDRGRGGPGGWIILDEPELHLGEDVLVPDLAGWRRETMPELPVTVGFTTAPDWLCEALSPSTARLDRVEKLPVYARAGVTHVWIIDAALQTLEVFRLDGTSYRLVATHAGDARGRVEPFEAIELELGALWSR